MAGLLNMSWITEKVKKGTVKYLIQRYLGHFLAKDLDTKMLDVDLPSGTGSISDIQLNEERINSEIAAYVPLKLMEGSVANIQLQVPYKDIWTESCLVNFEGIRLNFCKLSKVVGSVDGNASSSMLAKSLMSTSMEMAEEIVSQEKYDGLETIARLIDSVIRRFKVSIKDTVMKFILPKKSGLAQEIKLRIGKISIEEEELNLTATGPTSGGGEQQKSPAQEKYVALSDVMTKRIMVEGIELLINDILITKLYGKHTFKFRLDSTSSMVDLEAYLGSYIFAILSSDQLVVLREFLNFETSVATSCGDNLMVNGGRMMSSEDVRQIQAALKSKQRKRAANERMSGSLAKPQWTTGDLLDGSDDDDKNTEMDESQTTCGEGDESEDEKFKSFSSPVKKVEVGKSSTDMGAKLTCSLKVPGIMLCIVAGGDNEDDRPVFEQMPMIDSLQNFIGINQFLNEILHDYDHIRVMASSLFAELANEVFNFSCANLTFYEYSDKRLTNILWVKDGHEDEEEEEETGNSGGPLTTPSVRVRLKGQLVDIKVAPSVVKIDPTIIERHRRLFALVTGGGGTDNKPNHGHHQPYQQSPGRKRTKSTSMMILEELDDDGEGEPDELTINIECPSVELEVHFPIPDLRVDRDEFSALHDELLLVKLVDFSLRLNETSGDLVCSALQIDMRCPADRPGGDDRIRRLFRAQPEQKSITVHFSTKAQLQEEVISTAMLLSQVDSMADSINFMSASTMNHSNVNSPFQVNRKVFGKEGEEAQEKEDILTPGDRAATGNYLAHNKMSTKMFLYINIPYGDVTFEDKITFELIYNRIVNDLTLWTPYFPKATMTMAKRPPPEVNPLGTNFGDEVRLQIDPSDGGLFEDGNNSPQAVPIIPSLYSCTGGVGGSYLSESLDSVTSGDSFHSIMNTTVTGGRAKAAAQNEFMIELEIDNLNLNFHTKGKRKTGAFVQNLVLGLIVGPEAERSVILTINSDNLVLKSDDKMVIMSNSYLETNATSELNLAMEIKRESDTLKKIKLATQIQRALLLGLDLHIFEDLFDFVSLRDDEIIGYVCPKVVLELHTDVVDCGVSFEDLTDRPTLVHVTDVYLTSMVIENIEQTILHFFIEEALICFKRNNVCHESVKNYLPIVDSGVIDLTLILSKSGQIELKVWNNEINVKACSDSLAGLCLFLQSFGELIATQTADPPGESQEMDEGIEDNYQPHHHHHPFQQQHRQPASSVKNEIFMRKNTNGSELIAEALFECNDQQPVTTVDLTGEEEEEEKEAETNTPKIDESTFLILGEDDLGAGINLNSHSEPQVRALVDEQLKFTENHFPIGVTKVVPDKVKETLGRYLLDKLSVKVWLFGGYDFDDVPSEKLKEDEKARSETASLKSKTSTLKARSRYDTASQANYSMRNGRSTNTTIFGGGLNANSMSGSIREPKVRFQANPGNSVLWENIDLASHGMYAGGGYVGSHFSTPGGRPGKSTFHSASYTIKNNFGSRRKIDTKVTLTLRRMKLLFENFEKSYHLAWQFFLLVQDLEVSDEVQQSKFNKLLKVHSIENSQADYSNMFSIRLLCARNFQDQNEECDLRVSMRPLRINIDQDALIFLMDFFAGTSEMLNAKLASKTAATAKDEFGGGGSSRSSSKENIPMAGSSPRDFDDDYMSDLEDTRRMKRTDSVSSSASSSTSPAVSRRRRRTSSGSLSSCASAPGCCAAQWCGKQPPQTSGSGDLYIKSFVFQPPVPIRLDYQGKHINFKQGALNGLLMGLAQLNQSELCLKKLDNKHGLLGLDRVMLYAFEEWAKDIKRNQLPSILGGVGPMHSFIQLFQGVRDLFWMPIDQYRRDQRIVRGLQRGAYTFSLSTALATIDLANRVVNLINMTAQFAHDVVTPPTPGARQVGRMHNSQPRDFREGVAVAYTVMREGFHDTAHCLTNASYVSNDMSARIGEVVRQMPSTIVRPFIHGSQAISSVLVGMRNQLTPEARKDDHDKWKNANER